MKEDFLSRVRALPDGTAHIVNGECLKERILRERWTDAPVFSFNEAMCRGPAAETVFSEEFILARCAALGVSREEYEKKTVRELSGALSAPALALWFGDDMFCQINLIALLAWLDRQKYGGRVYCGTMRETEDRLLSFAPVSLAGRNGIYLDVFVYGKIPEAAPPETKKAAAMYLALDLPENPLRKCIRARLGEKDLLSFLLNTFPEYGLGDRQYLEMIEEEKNAAKNG